MGASAIKGHQPVMDLLLAASNVAASASDARDVLAQERLILSLGVFYKGLSLGVAANACDETGPPVAPVTVQLALKILGELNGGTLERNLHALVPGQAPDIQVDELGQVQKMPGVRGGPWKSAPAG